MKKLLICIVMLFFISGCEIASIESIKVKYPRAEIHQITTDEYIVVQGEEMRYIETDSGNIAVDFRIWRVEGRTNYIKDAN